MLRPTSYLSQAAIFPVLVLLLAGSAGAQEMADIVIESTDLGGGVHRLAGRGGNLAAFVGEDGVFLVDDQYAPLTDRILAAVRKISPEPVRFVLNTHWHGDHTGGNENLGRAGAVVVHFRSANVVHMGDIFWNGLYPFIDVYSGGSAKGVIAACDRVLAMIDDETRVIAGHGPLGDKKVLRAYRDMLAGIASRVEELLAQGKTLEEIQAAKPGGEFDEAWGTGFVKPDLLARLLYEDLSRGAE